MKCNYQILKDIPLSVDCYQGDVGVDDIIKLLDEKTEDLNYNANMSVLIDMRDSHIQLEGSDIQKYINYIKKNKKLHGERNIAYLISTTKQYRTGNAIRKYDVGIPLDIQLFDDIDHAIDWLRIPFRYKMQVEEHLVDIRV